MKTLFACETPWTKKDGNTLAEFSMRPFLDGLAGLHGFRLLYRTFTTAKLPISSTSARMDQLGLSGLAWSISGLPTLARTFQNQLKEFGLVLAELQHRRLLSRASYLGDAPFGRADTVLRLVGKKACLSILLCCKLPCPALQCHHLKEPCVCWWVLSVPLMEVGVRVATRCFGNPFE